MVQKRTATGGWYGVPPYTKEEELWIYGGDVKAITVVHRVPPAPPLPPHKAPPQSPEE
jgi:hypothetical protein